MTPDAPDDDRTVIRPPGSTPPAGSQRTEGSAGHASPPPAAPAPARMPPTPSTAAPAPAAGLGKGSVMAGRPLCTPGAACADEYGAALVHAEVVP